MQIQILNDTSAERSDSRACLKNAFREMYPQGMICFTLCTHKHDMENLSQIYEPQRTAPLKFGMNSLQSGEYRSRE